MPSFRLSRESLRRERRCLPRVTRSYVTCYATYAVTLHGVTIRAVYVTPASRIICRIRALRVFTPPCAVTRADGHVTPRLLLMPLRSQARQSIRHVCCLPPLPAPQVVTRQYWHICYRHHATSSHAFMLRVIIISCLFRSFFAISLYILRHGWRITPVIILGQSLLLALPFIRVWHISSEKFSIIISISSYDVITPRHTTPTLHSRFTQPRCLYHISFFLLFSSFFISVRIGHRVSSLYFLFTTSSDIILQISH